MEEVECFSVKEEEGSGKGSFTESIYTQGRVKNEGPNSEQPTSDQYI